MGSHRIVLVDDQREVREGLAELIGTHAGFEVVGMAASADEATQVLSGTAADLLLVDLVLGEGPDGIQLTKAVKAAQPLLPVLVLSGRHESLFAERALLAGASGYVMKDEAAAVLFAAMERTIAHGIWLSDDMVERLLPAKLTPRDPAVVDDELGRRLVAQLRLGNRTVNGLSRALSQPLAAVERGLFALQWQLQLPSRAALLLYLR